MTPSPLLATPLLALGLLLAGPACAQDATATAARTPPGFDIPMGHDRVRVELLDAGTLHVSYRRQDQPVTPTIVVDPHPPLPMAVEAQVHHDGDRMQLDSAQLHVRWDDDRHTLTIEDADHHVLLQQTDLSALRQGHLALSHAAGQTFYGIGGYNATEDVAAGLIRQGPQKATAAAQGHAGAPFAWTPSGYGVLFDAVGADVDLGATRLTAQATHNHHTGGGQDYYVFVGSPKALFAQLFQVSGPTPLFPKWAMGFTNSQWGIDEKELLAIVDTYRAKHIPIDNFTLDFDWKDWGKDWGEFRWNTRKFPDGPDGKLARMLADRGMHLTGIMKPRVHIHTVEGREAAAKGYFLAGNAPAKDYFSNKLIREIDFSNPAARRWFFDNLKPAFHSGMAGWWNDEADNVDIDTQHLDMQRAIYDGQRAISDQRVWSINRNFYLGAQRYAYGLWSGDIPTGFASMAGQRARMLSAIDVGAMQWGMDGGGFHGHPSDENYARWIEFGAFTPIFRVHGDDNEKRQPWVYGPVAEAAATAAIRLRYQLIPYIYSYEYQRRTHGVGLVRPLVLDWPQDPAVRNDVSAWMFGDALLVSPVVQQGQTHKQVYLPAGRWTDWFSGKVYAGGQTITVATDAQHWSDIPLYVRQGGIIPTQPVMDYVGQHPLTEVTVEMFPDRQPSHFTYYDDDGRTYAYEHGADFRQVLSLQRQDDHVTVQLGAVAGSYTPALRTYLLKLHGQAAQQVSQNGSALPHAADLAALGTGDSAGWTTGQDRFGPVTYVRVRAGQPAQLRLDGGMQLP